MSGIRPGPCTQCEFIFSSFSLVMPGHNKMMDKNSYFIFTSFWFSSNRIVHPCRFMGVSSHHTKLPELFRAHFLGHRALLLLWGTSVSTQAASGCLRVFYRQTESPFLKVNMKAALLVMIRTCFFIIIFKYSQISDSGLWALP